MQKPPYESEPAGEGGCVAGAESPSLALGGGVIHVRLDSGRVHIAVSGELDLGDSGLLQRALTDALDASDGGIYLDLDGVEMWDCSALNVLLSVRRRALAQGKAITITAASRICERLLTLTDTYPLFTPQEGDGTGSPDRRPSMREDIRDDLGAEVVQLRRAMQTRPDIDLARGILMASFQLTADEAWTVLVTASQNSNTKLHRLARDVVTTVKGDPLPDLLQEQLTAAVTRVHGLDDGRHRTRAVAGRRTHAG